MGKYQELSLNNQDRRTRTLQLKMQIARWLLQIVYRTVKITKIWIFKTKSHMANAT
jgi:hypothetical protein